MVGCVMGRLHRWLRVRDADGLKSGHRLRCGELALVALLLMTGCNQDSDPDDGADLGGPVDAPTFTPSDSDPPRSDTSENGPSDCEFEGDLEEFVDCTVDVAESAQDAPVSDVDPENPYPYTVEEYLSAVISDVDGVWSKIFFAAGLEEPRVGVQIVTPDSGPHNSRCTNLGEVAHDDPNAYYCGADHVVDDAGVVYEGTVILPVTTFQQMWTGDILNKQSKVVGDFAAALVVAHELGHHIEHEMSEQTQTPRPTGKNRELIADCFAGVWMASAYYSGLLEPGDFEEGVAALEAIGDELGTHGTSAERRDALLVGYNGIPGETAPGDPGACIQTYWF